MAHCVDGFYPQAGRDPIFNASSLPARKDSHAPLLLSTSASVGFSRCRIAGADAGSIAPRCVTPGEPQRDGRAQLLSVLGVVVRPDRSGTLGGHAAGDRTGPVLVHRCEDGAIMVGGGAWRAGEG